VATTVEEEEGTDVIDDGFLSEGVTLEPTAATVVVVAVDVGVDEVEGSLELESIALLL
jgi:hypothetical protein